MLFLPVEFNTVKTDALVDSGAYINAISKKDAENLRQDPSQCIINKAPPPRCEVQYANAEQEQPLATYTLRFKTGDYTFEETFIVMKKASFPILGLVFVRKHAAILDTAEVTIDFPKIQITMALTDEMQKCNLKPIMIKTEAKHTIPAHSTRIIYAFIPVSTDHSITGTTHPLPQFDECSKLMIAPAITTARDRKVATKIANTTDIPYTIPADTKVAELQYLKPEDNEEKFWFPTPENHGNELEYSPIQRKILKKIRELADLEKLDPTENAESTIFYQCSNGPIH